MANESDAPEEADRLLVEIEDDVRSFLLNQLPWSKMSPRERAHVKASGVDSKSLRRPGYISVKHTNDDHESSAEARASRCSVGAEGVMTARGENVVHLVFKCGNPGHPYHYSTFGLDTVVAMAKAAESTWPRSISRAILEELLRKRGLEMPDILDPGDDSVDLNEPDDEDDDIVI